MTLLAMLLLAATVAPQTAITNVTVIDTNGGPAKVGATVLIAADRIVSVGAADPPPDARVIDGSGMFLIPGLWDMHAHIWDSKLLFGAYVSHGITGVRDMGGALDAWRKWNEQIGRGEVVGPRAVVAGQIVDGMKPFVFFFRQAANPEEGIAVVGDLVERGADFIKVYDRLARSTYFAIAAEARGQGIPFAGHVPFGVRVSEAAAAGQKSIEHLSGIALDTSRDEKRLRAKVLAAIDEAAQYQGEGFSEGFRVAYETARSVPLDTHDVRKARRLYRQLRRHGTWQVPTLVVRGTAAPEEIARVENEARRFPEFVRGMIVSDAVRTKPYDANYRSRFEREKQIVREMHRAGIGILAGSDAPNPLSVPGVGLHDELALLVDAGLTPLEALQAATRNAARYLGEEHLRGSVEAGKVADLVLLEGNPLEDIRNTRRISAVFLGGRLLTKEDLERLRQ